MRVALLTNILSPYRVPVYEALAATPGWDLRVFVNAEREFDRRWEVDASGLDVELVPSMTLRRRVRSRGVATSVQDVTLHVPLGIPRALQCFAPDIVLSVELGARTLLARLYCAVHRVPLVAWSYHSRESATAVGPLQQHYQRWLLGGADAVVGLGRQAREVLRTRGVPDAKIFDALNAHDWAATQKALDRVNPAGLRESLSRGFGCRGRIALVAGRMIPVKGIEPLLARWRELPASLRDAWTLLFVGDGPLRSRVREVGQACERGEIVDVGEVDAAAMPGFHAAADLLVFPTLADNWGLVVNEAMAASRPVLCSRHAGCSDDLIDAGENGWIFDPVDERDFSIALRTALSCDALASMGRKARTRIEPVTAGAMAAGLRAALRAAATGRT